MKQAFTDARCKVGADTGQNRQTGPKLFRCRCVAVNRESIETDIREVEAVEVLLIAYLWREKNALGRDTASIHFLEDIGAGTVIVDHDPQQAVFAALKNGAPDFNIFRRDFTVGVEGRENERIFRQAEILARRTSWFRTMHRVVGLICFRQTAEFFVEIRLRMLRQHKAVADNVVYVKIDRCSGKTEP
ncbi:hypothetical protein D3C80_1270540 [compost metagenome]